MHQVKILQTKKANCTNDNHWWWFAPWYITQICIHTRNMHWPLLQKRSASRSLWVKNPKNKNFWSDNYQGTMVAAKDCPAMKFQQTKMTLLTRINATIDSLGHITEITEVTGKFFALFQKHSLDFLTSLPTKKILVCFWLCQLLWPTDGILTSLWLILEI